MKVYETKDIRNVGLVGHGHSGKTSLAAAMLYTSGATNRLGRADEGNSVTDFDEEEIQRKLTISTSVAYAEWKKAKINLLDTPGFNLFMNDTKACLVAADSALVVVDGVSGVEVMTEKVWNFASEYKLPRALVVNKLDRDRSSVERAMAGIQETFGRGAVLLQLPIGSERDFSGVIDLITMKAYTYTPDGDGQGKEQEIPAALSGAATKAHEQLVEMVAEGNDKLMEEFFEKGTLPEEHILEGIRNEMREMRLFPVLLCSASSNIGVDRIMDLLVEHLPDPSSRPGRPGKLEDADTVRAVADSEPASAFVFKTLADAFAGRVTYFKVCSGCIKNDDTLQNIRASSAERLSHLSIPFGKTLTPVTELHAGDIGVVAKLKDTVTGDTLADKASPIEYPAIKFPEPSIAYAVTAGSRADEDRMGNAIQKIMEEDQDLRFYRDPQTKQFLVAGAGSQHLEIVVSKLKKRYNVDVNLSAPKIPYRETIRGFADVHGRHKKQTGGHGQFGDCRIKMEPLPRGGNFEFVNEIFGGAIPKQYIPAVEKGVIEAAEKGYLAGFPVVDFKVILYDGSFHDVDSSELAFKLAARKAFKLAMEQAKPALLEPIMNVEISAPVEYAGDLMGDLNGRRGRINGMEVKGNTQIIRAQVPMAEMLTYQNDLISMTQGRASFGMEFDHYDYVPQQNMEKVVAAAKAEGTAVEEEEE